MRKCLPLYVFALSFLRSWLRSCWLLSPAACVYPTAVYVVGSDCRCQVRTEGYRKSGKMLSRWSARLAAAGVIVAVAAPSLAAATQSDYNASQIAEDQTLDKPFPYYFPQLQTGANAISGQFPMPLCHGFKLEEATIDQMQKEMADGHLTSYQIVKCYLERIYQTDFYVRYVRVSTAPMIFLTPC